MAAGIDSTRWPNNDTTVPVTRSAVRGAVQSLLPFRGAVWNRGAEMVNAMADARVFLSIELGEIRAIQKFHTSRNGQMVDESSQIPRKVGGHAFQWANSNGGGSNQVCLWLRPRVSSLA